MSEHEVVFTFTGRNLVKATTDEVTGNISGVSLSVRGLAMDFSRAGTSIMRLNNLLGLNNATLKQMAAAFETVGAAMSVISIIRDFSAALTTLTSAQTAATIAEHARGAATAISSGITSAAAGVEMGFATALFAVRDSSIATAIAENARGAATAFTTAVSSAGAAVSSAFAGAIAAITASSTAAAIAEHARAAASFIANAVSTFGVAVPIMLAAAAAVGGLAIYESMGSHQFGTNYVAETGLYQLHQGESVKTASETRNSAMSINVDARGSTFASNYDADKLTSRMLSNLRRNGFPLQQP